MTTLTRSAFLQEMANKAINIQTAQRDSRLSVLNLAALERQTDGLLTGNTEIDALFSALDRFDNNGQVNSIEIGTNTQPTRVGILVNVLRQFIVPAPVTPSTQPNTSGRYKDAALNKAFASGLSSELVRGARGAMVVAVQYALGRLGYVIGLCDGSFGKMTEDAINAFQTQAGLTPTGRINSALLVLLDNALVNIDLRTPAAKAADPLAYLSNFRALNLPEIVIRSTAETFSWNSIEIQQAYGQFVGPYWDVMKQNKVEADCKSMALFLMDQFRKQLKEDRFIDLPHPVLGRAPEKRWIVSTTDKSLGLFRRADELLRNERIRVQRPGYQAILQVQALDPVQSMIVGVNVHYPELSADQVAKSCTRLFNWSSTADNRGDSTKPEVPVNQLAPGNIIFIDHTGDGKFDHTVNVIKVEKDSANRTRKLVLAVGSYDDARDSNADTSVDEVGMSIVNLYGEEVVVELDTRGIITSSTVTYSSEPSYLVDTRYSARTTLMEQKAGGRLIVARWG